MSTVSVGAEACARMYATMVRIKAVDELIRKALATGRLTQFYFPVRGQEAIPAAMAAVCRTSDYLVTTYRGLHDEIAKGAPLQPVLAELFGRDGIHGGRGGPMHICDLDSGTILTSGIVGSGIPMAVGVATANQVRGDGRVTFCSFGDGATNTGAFHEGMNLAAVWELPLVFLCQNNQFAESTRTDETFRAESLVARAAAYGMPAMCVDGYDPIALYEAISAAVDRARAGDGPTFIEATCFRYFGHYFGDQMYRVPPELLAAEMEKDPLPTFRARVLADGILSEDQLAAIEAEEEAVARAAFEGAIATDMPDAGSVLTGVYASPVTGR